MKPDCRFLEDKYCTHPDAMKKYTKRDRRCLVCLSPRIKCLFMEPNEP